MSRLSSTGFLLADVNKEMCSMRLSLSLWGLALVTLMAGRFAPAFAQNAKSTLAGANAHASEMQRLFPDGNQSSQATPRLIPKLEIDQDLSGAIEAVQPNGPALTAKNAFSWILAVTGALASPVINRRTGGRSAQNTRVIGLTQTSTTRSFACSTAPRVRRTTSRRRRLSGRHTAFCWTRA